MNEEAAAASAPAGAPTAGRLLREAREKQGLHIAALAASIKVAPKKLELLESDRIDELPDATFARALAQTVCRALKVDPAPVMRLLPPPRGQGLENVGEGLNAPFRERPGALVQSAPVQLLSNPGYWLAGLLAVAAIAVFFLPPGVLGIAGGASRPASAPRGAVEPGMPPDGLPEAALAGTNAVSSPLGGSASAAVATTAVPASAAAAVPVAPASTAVARVEATPPASQSPASRAAAAANAPAPTGMLQLRATAPSWIEVTDGRGQPVFSRLLRAGEAIGVDGTPPLRVRVGNAAGTELVFRGQPTDLRAFTSNNVARLELR